MGNDLFAKTITEVLFVTEICQKKPQMSINGAMVNWIVIHTNTKHIRHVLKEQNTYMSLPLNHRHLTEKELFNTSPFKLKYIQTE